MNRFVYILVISVWMLMAVFSVSSAHAAVWGSSAVLELTGSRDSGGNGITGLQDWAAGGFSIAWEITELAPSTWRYEYTVDVTQGEDKVKDVSHFILELTSDLTAQDIFDGTSAPLEGPQMYGQSSGNPLMPNSFYGVKFDFGGSQVSYTIETNRAPVYGNMYAKDGKTKGNDVVAWNDALAFADYETNEILTIEDFIVRPDGDGLTTAVPVPGAVWLLGAGLTGLFGLRKRG